MCYDASCQCNHTSPTQTHTDGAILCGGTHTAQGRTQAELVYQHTHWPMPLNGPLHSQVQKSMAAKQAKPHLLEDQGVQPGQAIQQLVPYEGRQLAGGDAQPCHLFTPHTAKRWQLRAAPTNQPEAHSYGIRGKSVTSTPGFCAHPHILVRLIPKQKCTRRCRATPRAAA